MTKFVYKFYAAAHRLVRVTCRSIKQINTKKLIFILTFGSIIASFTYVPFASDKAGRALTIYGVSIFFAYTIYIIMRKDGDFK